jgi:hypothetical protein
MIITKRFALKISLQPIPVSGRKLKTGSAGEKHWWVMFLRDYPNQDHLIGYIRPDCGGRSRDKP